MEKRVQAKVVATCLGCAYREEGIIEAASEEELRSEVHKFFTKHSAAHSCDKPGKACQWHLWWGPIELY